MSHSAPVRSEILETGNPRIKSARITIDAPAQRVFDLLADPRGHPTFDGSSSVLGLIKGPERLALGSTFGMRMKLGVPYRVTNTVVEFQENQTIAWRHVGRWRWRYELVSAGPNQTVVTESFDATMAPWLSQRWLNFRDAYPWTQRAVAKTLVKLKEVAESS
jgi:uncharacterized protein YndB with AHSA1/START domain